MMIAEDGELFRNPSWLAVYIGQNIMPERAPVMTELRSNVPAESRMADVRRAILDAASSMPTHQEFIDRYAPAAQV